MKSRFKQQNQGGFNKKPGKIVRGSKISPAGDKVDEEEKPRLLIVLDEEPIVAMDMSGNRVFVYEAEDFRSGDLVDMVMYTLTQMDVINNHKPVKGKIFEQQGRWRRAVYKYFMGPINEKKGML